MYDGRKFREGAALEREELQKNKTVEVVKAIFMILLFPITLLVYGIRAIARSCAPERKIIVQTPEAHPEHPVDVLPPKRVRGVSLAAPAPAVEPAAGPLPYGKAEWTPEERASFNAEYLLKIIAETPPIHYEYQDYYEGYTHDKPPTAKELALPKGEKPKTYYKYGEILQHVEFAGFQTEILPGLILGGLNCDTGRISGYAKEIEKYFKPGA